MKKLLCVVALVGMLMVPGAVQAQMNVGPIVAYHTDGEMIGAGGFVGIPLPQLSEGFSLIPNFLWWFPDAGTMFEVNGDLAYYFPVSESAPVMPFAFAGLNIFRTSFDFGGLIGSVSSTDVGLNVGGGVQFQGSLQPFAGAKFEVQDGTGFAVFGGIGFPIGGN